MSWLRVVEATEGTEWRAHTEAGSFGVMRELLRQLAQAGGHSSGSDRWGTFPGTRAA